MSVVGFSPPRCSVGGLAWGYAPNRTSATGSLYSTPFVAQ